MQRTKVLALCVAVLLAFSGLVSAKQGIDIKASLLFGAKLDVDDVIVASEGEGALGWTWEGKDDDDPVLPDDADPSTIDVKLTQKSDAKKIAVSPEEEGYPILLEATYNINNFQIGGFWLTGFKAAGEKEGSMLGFSEQKIEELGEFISDPYGKLTTPSVVFLPDVADAYSLPGLYIETLAEETGGPEDLFIEGQMDSLWYFYDLPWEDEYYDPEMTFNVRADKGITKWEADVSFSLFNYGGTVGYTLFEQNNIGATLMAGLEQLKWEQEVNIDSIETGALVSYGKANYDVYAYDDGDYILADSGGDEITLAAGAYEDLIEALYADKALEILNGAFGLEEIDFSNLYLAHIAIDDSMETTFNRSLKIARELDYNPTGYSIGANVGGLVADKLRVKGSFSIGWFSGDATVKLAVEDKLEPGYTPPSQEGTTTWDYYSPGGNGDPIKVTKNIPFTYGEIEYEDDAEAVEEFFAEIRKDTFFKKDEKHADTEVTVTKAQVSAEYDVTDAVFLGGGFFYSQWKDMPVLSNKSALEIEKQDLVASGIKVEVGVRF